MAGSQTVQCYHRNVRQNKGISLWPWALGGAGGKLFTYTSNNHVAYPSLSVPGDGVCPSGVPQDRGNWHDEGNIHGRRFHSGQVERTCTGRYERHGRMRYEAFCVWTILSVTFEAQGHNILLGGILTEFSHPLLSMVPKPYMEILMKYLKIIINILKRGISITVCYVHYLRRSQTMGRLMIC